MKLLVTGGAGFIGSNFVNYMIEKHDSEVKVLDKLTYAGNLNNLKDVMDKIEFVEGDICDKDVVEKAMKDCNIVLNFAAETHVDRSITDAGLFVKTDVIGTYTLLEAARKYDIEKFIQISTDEVYGSIEEGSFRESDPLEPSSPYSASKASGDLLVHSYYVTYGLPVIITRSSNNFGPYQHTEKFIPTLITNAIQNKALPLYGDGNNVRDWIYVMDNCEAIDIILKKGKINGIYNIGAGNERKNSDVANMILKELNKPRDLIKFVEDRLGHDWRYSIDCTKIKKLGWKPMISFEEGLKKSIGWYVENKWWWDVESTG